MDTRVNKIATAVGAALLGLALAQPATSQQRDPASSGSAGTVQSETGGPTGANPSCDGLQGAARENCLAARTPDAARDRPAASGSSTLRNNERDMPRDSASSGTSERRGIRGFFSRDRDTAANRDNASVGTSTMARDGRAADAPFQGSNPANTFCDQQLGRAKADCLEYNSTGNAIQQGSGD